MKIKAYNDRWYTMKECYALCLKTDFCQGFIIGSKTMFCILFKMGCTNDNDPIQNAYYAMETCSGTNLSQEYILKI